MLLIAAKVYRAILPIAWPDHAAAMLRALRLRRLVIGSLASLLFTRPIHDAALLPPWKVIATAHRFHHLAVGRHKPFR